LKVENFINTRIADARLYLPSAREAVMPYFARKEYYLLAIKGL
jgi:hypothetical protein